MLDAVCVFDKDNPKTYSIFDFKKLPEAEIDKLRYSLLCPVCGQKAYFRRASKDGRQACFGSRYHTPDCSEFNSSTAKSEEQLQIAEVEKLLCTEDALLIDFSAVEKSNKKIAATELKTKAQGKPSRSQKTVADDELKVCKQGLAKLLTSLLHGSSLARSDLWIYTSEKHKWRAKNLFVNIADAQPTDNGSPRMYWGTISYADKTLNWLNPAEDRNVGLPISRYREQLLKRFAIKESADVEGAGFIIFAKCVLSKDKKRRYLQLWGNDLRYFYLSKVDG
jgi:hypothetical protein